MAPKTLDEYVNWEGWTPRFEQLAEGEWRVTLALLPDFEVFAPSKAELEEEWKLALRSHLSAYLQFQKRIPFPEYKLPEHEIETSNGSPGQTWWIGVQLLVPRSDTKAVV